MSDQHPASGTSDDYEGIELEATAQAKNYTRWILDSIREHLGPVIVEVGAGRGTFTAELLGAGDGRVVAIEPSVHLFPLLKEALGGHPRADLRHGTLAQHAQALEGHADSLVYINVIEHIAEHHAELEQAYRVLAPGGRICVFV